MIENIWGEHGQNGCGQSDDRTLKLTVSENWADRINWFFACSYRFTKNKGWTKRFWVSMFKNGCGHSAHRTLKLTVFQKWTDGKFDFLHVVTNSGKLKVDSVIFGCSWSKTVMAFYFMRP